MGSVQWTTLAEVQPRPVQWLWEGRVPLGKVTYSDTTGSVSGDIACARGGTARLTATANDRNLTNVTIIPLQVATPVRFASTRRVDQCPVLLCPSDLGIAAASCPSRHRREFLC